MIESIVLVGGGLAAAWCARTLRQEGYEGRLILVGEEPHLPYDRPPLSKEFLRGEQPRARLDILPAAFYEQNHIEVHLGRRATRLEVPERRLHLDDGTRLTYDRLLLCTGGSPRRLRLPGAELEGLHYLRTVDDSQRLAEKLRPGRRAVLIGTGFIGLELAASFRKKGLLVVGIDVLPLPLEPILGPEVGRFFADMHRAEGVELRLGERVERLEGQGRLQRVVTDRGAYECDFAVAGIGIIPNLDLVQGTPLETGNGLLVDAFCRTNVPEIFAAGDIANMAHPRLGRRLRVEHWQSAMLQGAAAARAMLDRGKPYEELPWFWTDQYNVNVQTIGHVEKPGPVVLRGEPQSRSFCAFYLEEGRLHMALTCNRPKEQRAARRLIEARIPVTPEQLADESVDLRTLA
ncbi:MAG TPA: FAD-dependent oxidoreductase [Candidatus Nitrosotenuis sp.]|jgi:3-phenylpropionate/trans-cinnamate dioxygenase ferredoxin reductase subunit|nr:FAD-dependent oxidoreductase [Candidatus Nitrosotenuis sp.]